MKNRSRFVIKKTGRGTLRWEFDTANGKTLAVSGRGFRSEKAARQAIYRVKKFAPDAPVVDQAKGRADAQRDAVFEIYQEGDGDYRWRFEAPEGKVVARSRDGYSRKRDCRRTLAVLKREAPEAPVVGMGTEEPDESPPVVKPPIVKPPDDEEKKSGRRLPPSVPPVTHSAGPSRRGAMCALCCRACQGLPPALRAPCEAACARIPGCAC